MILTSKRSISFAIVSNRVGVAAKMEPYIKQGKWWYSATLTASTREGVVDIVWTGFHYWFLDLLLSMLFIFLPVTALRDYPVCELSLATKANC